jgi:hypothetical protein
MILIGDVDVMTRPHIMANINCQVANDSATPSDQTPITDTHNWIGETLLARNHSSGKSNMASDHGVGSNMDVLLIENCRLWKANNAVLTECPEAHSSRCVRSD